MLKGYISFGFVYHGENHNIGWPKFDDGWVGFNSAWRRSCPCAFIWDNKDIIVQQENRTLLQAKISQVGQHH